MTALHGIDLRPMDGKVYGVAADGAPMIVDFNPAADKLRLMAGTTNLRVDPASGKVTADGDLAFQAAGMHYGKKPDIVAAAYTNADGKPGKTAMYDVDRTIGVLVRQVSPNDGTLATVGKLGVPRSEHYAFDVQTTADGTNTPRLMTEGTLYQADLGRCGT